MFTKIEVIASVAKFEIGLITILLPSAPVKSLKRTTGKPFTILEKYVGESVASEASLLFPETSPHEVKEFPSVITGNVSASNHRIFVSLSPTPPGPV